MHFSEIPEDAKNLYYGLHCTGHYAKLMLTVFESRSRKIHTFTRTHKDTISITPVFSSYFPNSVLPMPPLGPYFQTTSETSHGPVTDITTQNALRLIGALPSIDHIMEEKRRHSCKCMQWPVSVCPTPIHYRFPE